MVSVRYKTLDANLDLIFRSSNKQYMLSRLADDPKYHTFFKGNSLVQILTPSKESFLARFEAKQNYTNHFNLFAQKMPSTSFYLKDTLILIFQFGDVVSVSQATVRDIIGTRILVEAVDPRVDPRIKTRIVIEVMPITSELLNQLKEKKISIKRVTEVESTLQGEDPLCCKDLLALSPSDTVDPKLYLSNYVKPSQAMMADISAGGCCLYVPKDLPLQNLKDLIFIYTNINIPSLGKEVTIRIFCAIRQTRQVEKYNVLHCKFIEAIPKEMLVL